MNYGSYYFLTVKQCLESRLFSDAELRVRRRKSCNWGMRLGIFQRSDLFKKLRTPEVVAWNSVSFGQGCENKSLWGLTPPTSVGVVDDFVRRGGDRQQRIWDIPRGRQFPTTDYWPPSLGRIKYLSLLNFDFYVNYIRKFNDKDAL